MSIPVVDFGAYRLDEKGTTEEHLHELGKALKAAFTEVGFVFLKNSGITQEEVDRVMDISKKFFLQPEELKRPFCRSSFTNSPNHGWVSLETERLNPLRPGDLKEAFNTASLDPDIKWPSSGDVAGFQEIQTSFFLRCRELSLRVLRVMALGLGLDPEVFLSAHRLIGTDENGTTLRSLYYPLVNSEKAKEGQLRCGEHSDYGSITLLFQSSEGLQVRTRSGEFICAPVIPGAVLINIADLMQRWTGDYLVSVLHRVLLPPVGDSSTRQSLAFFVQPDDAALITCYDGSNKYPPVTAGAYLTERFNDSYGRT
ncbi:2-oxoglutarate-Fe(II) type oxidoreductase ppzD isoform X2 [Mugil cephalus]|uniref:2-oxoglutarate-Fe(II) type oxidoreductase ppzD isoform X2 n=1 Tax=Mugil cephalus TaxID=48193 RepID=UPI001FB7B4D9|nr:2-oxoglutarate-Fe(II) type oxidoreductase ppzD isoform X2 [Mugil cephalus]